MSVCDPVSDFLTRIRNAIYARHKYVDLDLSKVRESVAEILKKNGLIDNYLIRKGQDHRGTMRIFLKYTSSKQSVIQGLKRVSRPGLRKYVGYKKIPNFFGGLGLSVLSTSMGVISGKDAMDRKVGGELLCLIW